MFMRFATSNSYSVKEAQNMSRYNIKEVLNEHLKALDKVGKRKQFEELKKTGSTTEVQVNLAAAILAETGVIRTHHSGGNVTNLNESSSSFSEESSTSLSEGFEFRGDGKELQVRSTMMICNITEAEARRALGLPITSGAEVRSKLNLTESETSQYVASVRGGESEAVALVMVCPRIAKQLREAINRGMSVPQFLESLG
jgi:hypothetical protein